MVEIDPAVGIVLREDETDSGELLRVSLPCCQSFFVSGPGRRIGAARQGAVYLVRNLGRLRLTLAGLISPEHPLVALGQVIRHADIGSHGRRRRGHATRPQARSTPSSTSAARRQEMIALAPPVLPWCGLRRKLDSDSIWQLLFSFANRPR